MDTYKLKPNENYVNKINIENFEKDTFKQAPYYQSGKNSQYAVCPACNNPINIIGLYNSNKKIKPYGKHYPKSVDNLAIYNRYRYEMCPLAINTWKDTDKTIKNEVDEVSKEAIDFMKINFDSIVRLLRKITGIIFNDKIITQMVNNFFSLRGYCYHKIYTMNSAWIFGYMQCRINFFGMVIDETHPIYNVLISHPNIKLNNNRIIAPNNTYIKPEFYFMLHRTKQKQNIKSEYIDYYIDINDKNIYKQEIKINLELFSKIINRKTKKTTNDNRYLEIFNNTYEKYSLL